jgi:hypothetical protein
MNLIKTKKTEIMKINDKNMYGKRTANMVNAILRANNFKAKALNLGNGIDFQICIESNIKNRYELKKMGFILGRGKAGDKFINIKCC